MNFAAVLFSTVFLLHNAVKIGNFLPTEKIDDPEKRTGIAAAAAAKQIYGDIRGAAPALAAGKQFGFLYLHDGKAAVNYGSKPVKDAIKNKKLDDKLDPRPARPPFWPANPRNTYILIAMPNKKPHGCVEQDNHGHSEYKMLQELEELRAGFYERNKFEGNRGCPEYVILATVLNPCFDAEVPKRFGCAQDYVEQKKQFIDHCQNTNFHLYVPKPDDTNPRWPETEKLMADNNINIITGTN